MITIKVEDLRKLLEALDADEVEYVDLDIDAYDEEEKYLTVDGYDGYGGGSGYDALEGYEVDPNYRLMAEEASDDLVTQIQLADTKK